MNKIDESNDAISSNDNLICFNNQMTNFKNIVNKSNILFTGLDNNNILHLNQVIGVLKLSNKQFKTTTSKNYIMKEFQPFDINIPYFMVKTNKLLDKKDKYVIVKILFDGIKISGLIEQYIGDVGDIHVEKTLCTQFALSNWSMKINKIFKQNIDYTMISRDDLTPDRQDFTNIFTLSIDPNGSVDIDDALGIEFLEDNYIKIYVHIADPSSYLIEDSILDNEIASRAESFYLIDKTSHMFPDILSTELFSLKEQQIKRAFTITILLKYHEDAYEIIDKKITKSLINVNKNMSYEECQKILNTRKNNYPFYEQLKKLYDIGMYFYKTKFNIDNIHEIYDTKKMVEIFMIYSNNIVAETMIKLNNNRYPLIIRKQSNMNINKLDDEHICYHDDYMKLQYEKAILKIYDETDNNRHEILNLDAYTHFTSPIRRYSDILVHRTLYNLLTNTQTFTLTKILNDNQIHQLFDLNYYKQFYKRLSILEQDIIITHKIIETIGYYPHDRIIHLEGIILSIDDSITNKMNMKYIKIKCLNIHIIDDNNIDKMIIEHFINKIHTIKTEQEVELFEKIQYKICFLNNSIKKMKAYL